MEILYNAIYPALYERIETALPEFGFKRTGSGYVSTTDIKVTGETGKRGKVYIYDNNISHIIDYTRSPISIWDYIQKKENLSQQETLLKLADLSGVSLPQNNYTPETLQLIEKEKRQAGIWEEANSFFISSLEKNETIMGYLQERGYKEHYNTMELGYIPSQEALKKYLRGKGYGQEEIAAINLNAAIGASHTLTIPFRDHIGRIKGVGVRNISYEVGDGRPKYMYSTGLERSNILFNLKSVRGDRDLIVTEGLLDALHSAARGIENIVALGGTSLNASQIALAKKYGATKITLCLDNDTEGHAATQRAIGSILKAEGIRAYIAELPEGIKDPDQLIREQGVEHLRKALKQAKPVGIYRAETILKKYADLGEDTTYKDRDNLLNEVTEEEAKYADPLERRDFINTVIRELPADYNITEEIIRDKAQEIRDIKEKIKEERALRRLIKDAGELADTGKIKAAHKLIEEQSKAIRVETAKDLIEAYTYEDWEKEITSTPDSLRTGIAALDEILGIPQGAITLIAGRPSHGKTTLLYNLLLYMAAEYKEKKFYFFSYEENKKFILAKILNRLAAYEITGIDGKTTYDRLHGYLRERRTDIAEIEAAKQTLKELLEGNRIEIIDKPYTVEELSKVIGYKKIREDIGAVFIDYIQRIPTERPTHDKRTEVAHISDYILQNISKQLELPVILGAQLNREVKKKEIDAITEEHLKEAGNLEEDANMIIALYNKSKDQPPEDGISWPRRVNLDIKILKNRNGIANTKARLDYDRYTGFIQ